jgi:uncharacterized protein (TIGR00255 family)
MTGFGKCAAKVTACVFIAEVRTLNSKTLDINLRIPAMLREKESVIRAEIARVLERGKVDVVISTEMDADAATLPLDKTLVKKYYHEIRELAAELGEKPGKRLLPAILSLPEVLKPARETYVEDEWPAILDAIVNALQQTDDFRRSEGELLAKDIAMRIEMILSLLEQIEPIESQRIQHLRERFDRNQKEFLDTSLKTEKFDENRFEQEIFWYLERLDITEEKLRLRKHCDYFRDTLETNESVGRKLGFICQEIGREINTLGSKAYNAEIQIIVVQMKDELEKVKEQIANIL